MFRPLDEELDVYGLTHPGKVQKVSQGHFMMGPINRQMTLHHASIPDGSGLPMEGERLAYVVIIGDGSGRGKWGAMASRHAVEAVAQYFVFGPRSYRTVHAAEEQGLLDGLQETVSECNARLLHEARADHAARGMRSKLLVCLFIWPRIYVMHVGDCRYYVYRDQELTQITKDQGGEYPVPTGQLVANTRSRCSPDWRTPGAMFTCFAARGSPSMSPPSRFAHDFIP